MDIEVIVVANAVQDMALAVDTAWSARPLGASVTIVAPEDATPWPLPAGCGTICHSGDIAAAVAPCIPANGAVLMLVAGERLLSSNWQAASAHLRNLAPGTPADVATADGLEQRVMVPARLTSPKVVPHLTIRSMPEQGPVTPSARPLAV